MRNRILLVTGLLALCSMASAQVARAQQALVADIPFAFVAGKASLPAGEYYVQSMSDNSAVTLIRRGDASAAAMVITIATQGNQQHSDSKLVFHRYGNRYFLSQFWTEGSTRGRQLPQSDREKELVIAKSETPAQVTLVARLSTPRR
jgi:hypothetical protein